MFYGHRSLQQEIHTRLQANTYKFLRGKAFHERFQVNQPTHKVIWAPQAQYYLSNTSSASILGRFTLDYTKFHAILAPNTRQILGDITSFAPKQGAITSIHWLVGAIHTRIPAILGVSAPNRAQNYLHSWCYLV